MSTGADARGVGGGPGGPPRCAATSGAKDIAASTAAARLARTELPTPNPSPISATRALVLLAAVRRRHGFWPADISRVGGIGAQRQAFLPCLDRDRHSWRNATFDPVEEQRQPVPAVRDGRGGECFAVPARAVVRAAQAVTRLRHHEEPREAVHLGPPHFVDDRLVVIELRTGRCQRVV